MSETPEAETAHADPKPAPTVETVEAMVRPFAPTVGAVDERTAL